MLVSNKMGGKDRGGVELVLTVGLIIEPHVGAPPGLQTQVEIMVEIVKYQFRSHVGFVAVTI